MFVSALTLSAIAAYYSLMGLAAIFAAAVVPIIVMGGVLEASKLVVASWVYRNWKEAPFLLKSYLSFAVIILMVITSMGIFGFLSKAHLDQTISTGDYDEHVTFIDEQIKIERETIANAKSLTEQKRYYASSYGIENYVDIVNGKTDTIKKSENYDRYNVDTIIEWWRKLATKRYNKIKEEGRLRNDLEIWTKDSQIDIIR